MKTYIVQWRDDDAESQFVCDSFLSALVMAIDLVNSDIHDAIPKMTLEDEMLLKVDEDKAFNDTNKFKFNERCTIYRSPLIDRSTLSNQSLTYSRLGIIEKHDGRLP